MSRDQRQLREILALAQEASDAAYDLHSRRLDTSRNIDSFILLVGAVNLLEKVCKILETAVAKATETKSSGKNTLTTEILARAARAQGIDDDPYPDNTGTVISLSPKKS